MNRRPHYGTDSRLASPGAIHGIKFAAGHFIYRNRQAFVDEQLPRDFVPFNVQAIGNDIVVTYVLHQEGNLSATDSLGLDYVDIYSSSGRLLRRLEQAPG
jgi:hypothetical protein